MHFKLKPIVRSLTLAFGGALGTSLIALPTHAQVPTQQQQPQTLERIEVTGSNIRRTDVEGPQPVVTITREAIERSGRTTLSELIQQLPVASGGTFTEAQNAGNSFAPGTAGVSLRGLGANTVLVLLNGRRVAGYGFAQNITEAFVDLNSIPLSAIERIDILKDGASAIYGSDAIAGVINIILRRDYRGVEVGGLLGTTKDGGGDEYRANVIGGWGNLARDRFNVLATIDYFKREELKATDRDFSRSSNQALRGGFDQRSPTGNPGTWVIPGQPRQRFAGCPPELQGSSGGQPACLYEFSPFLALLPETERIGIFTRGIFDFTPNFGAFAEVGYTRNETFNPAAATPLAVPVPAANPSNPFGVPVTAIYRTVDIGGRNSDIESDNLRVLGGLRGTFGTWDWETAANYSKNEVTNTGRNFVVQSRFNQAVAGTLPGFEGTFYNLTNNAANSPALLEALRYTQTRQGEGELRSVDAKLSGQLFQLPGGTAAMAVGAEYREEEIADVPDPFIQQGLIAGSGGTSARGERDNRSAYLEFSLPFIRNLETQLAVRYDDYSDFGSQITPKVALSFRPAQGLLLRGGYGQGFRAPSLVELFLGDSRSFPNFVDTPRCNAYRAAFGVTDPRSVSVCSTAQRLSTFGGNPQLDAEESENIFAGFVFDVTPNFSLSADYYNIFHENIVISPTLAFTLANAGQFPPGTISRVPQNANDIAAGAPGALTGTTSDAPDTPAVRRTFINATEQKTWGYDLEARYRFDITRFGRFTLGAFATYVGSLRVQLNPGQPLVELVDSYEYPRWRGNTSLLWETGPWATTLQANYRHSFDQGFDPPPGGPSRVDRFTTWDLNLTYTGIRNTTLAVGGTNIFNQDPPFSNVPNTGYSEGIDNPRGAFYYVRARYKFF